MEKKVLQVEGMACGHCVAAVNNALAELEGIGSVTVDLAAKTVTVEHDAQICPLAKITEAIEDEGYEVVG